MSTTHKPYIAESSKLPELTLMPLLMGVVLGILFGASSLFLVLRVGMTVSASIPVAVLSITLFRALAKAFKMRPANILENNIVQTAGSAGESIAFGVGVTMPALMILGFDMDLIRVMTVSVLGGLLGILMMIPLRKTLVESPPKGQAELIFPEGTACAQVLVVGEEGGTTAKTVFLGFFLGFFYKIFNVANKLWGEALDFPVKVLKGAKFASEVSPELLGVGYIIGYRNSAMMAAGGVLSAFILTPAIYLFGGGLKEPLFPATKLISEMGTGEIRNNYVLYIGAGAVAAAGIFSMIQNLPIIYRAAVSGIQGLLETKREGKKSIARTSQDIPMKWVVVGVLGLVAAIAAQPSLHVGFVGAILIIVFGFLFVTVSSRITGEIGSSSNPISGMTVATLLITSLIFLAMGWVSLTDRLAALSIAAIVCIAASNGGTTAQDLKTGHLVGATPKLQQIAILFGALTSALVIGLVLKQLDITGSVYTKKELPAVRYEGAASLKTEPVLGVEAEKDSKIYRVLRVNSETAVGSLAKVPHGKYLLDDAGAFVYRVDPGVNGTLTKRDDGTDVKKFDAPKAHLMALIIDGVLTQKLPWGLVLLGVFLVVMLELCGIPSLAFAVGVYLPIAASMPIFFGGLVRKIRDHFSKKEEDDSGPGVLLSSGLIAGGSIAGIGIAFASLNSSLMNAVDFSGWSKLGTSEIFPVVPFAALAGYLLWVALAKKR